MNYELLKSIIVIVYLVASAILGLSVLMARKGYLDFEE